MIVFYDWYFRVLILLAVGNDLGTIWKRFGKYRRYSLVLFIFSRKSGLRSIAVSTRLLKIISNFLHSSESLKAESLLEGRLGISVRPTILKKYFIHGMSLVYSG